MFEIARHKHTVLVLAPMRLESQYLMYLLHQPRRQGHSAQARQFDTARRRLAMASSRHARRCREGALTRDSPDANGRSTRLWQLRGCHMAGLFATKGKTDSKKKRLEKFRKANRSSICRTAARPSPDRGGEGGAQEVAGWLCAQRAS